MGVAKQWYYKCENCGKTIKRKIKRNLICQNCTRVEKSIKCLQCGELFHPKKSVNKYCSTSCSSKHTLTGRKLSIKHRENLSKSASVNSNGLVKCKFYKIFNPYLNKEVSVQGTYELKYAKYLNENNIKWNRGKHINLKYFHLDLNRLYYPDFYLVDENVYIETKGYFFDADKIKMEKVISQNNDKIIKILLKEDLINLGINI